MAKDKNLPVDHKWVQDLGAMGKNHAFVDGEYVETTYVHQSYPKTKYHADYVHDRKEGQEYQFTQLPQTVLDMDEEILLGEDWKDSPAYFCIQTCPDAESQAKKKRAIAAAGANWRAAVPGANNQALTEAHVHFLQANGMPEIKSLGDAYTFLSGMTSTQMSSFMKEAAEWGKANTVGAGKKK
jgi:hypothetical protein